MLRISKRSTAYWMSNTRLHIQFLLRISKRSTAYWMSNTIKWIKWKYDHVALVEICCMIKCLYAVLFIEIASGCALEECVHPRRGSELLIIDSPRTGPGHHLVEANKLRSKPPVELRDLSFLCLAESGAFNPHRICW